MAPSKSKGRLGVSSQLGSQQLNSISICSLPKDIIELILARVAASSRTDLFKAKRSCRLFIEVASGNYIYQNISLNDIPFKKYQKSEESFFFRKCLECDNPEALFMEGIIYFFNDPKDEYGVSLLKRAAEMGHVKASYILGIDRFCNGNDRESEEEAMELLGNVKSSQAMRECRLWLENKFIWVLNRSVKSWSTRLKLLSCPMIDPKYRTHGWPLEEDRMSCHICRWNIEIQHVYSITNRTPYAYCPKGCESIIKS